MLASLSTFAISPVKKKISIKRPSCLRIECANGDSASYYGSVAGALSKGSSFCGSNFFTVRGE